MSIDRRNAIKIIASYAILTNVTTVFAQTSGFDHNYADWNALLQKHVKWLPDGKQSRMDYRGLAADRTGLQAVLAQWSAVTPAQFAAFSRGQQMAFLINAYNGFTAELILTKYPGIKSIKDVGSLLQSPWKNQFFTLLGDRHHLDWIEHEQLRPKFNDPRVHAAVNCASIGCPALRPDAFTAAKLDAQLSDGMTRFMGDRSRNRYNAQTDKLEVNAIFKWFREDFEKGQRGFSKLEDVFAFYADQLTEDAAGREKLRAKTVAISFLDYDWSLNDVGR